MVMNVINIINLQLDGSYDSLMIESVPDDYMQCATTGQYLTKSEFTDNKDFCKRAALMTVSDRMKLVTALSKIKNSHTYQDLSYRLEMMNIATNYGVTVKAMIDKLSMLDPNAVLLSSFDDGYCAPIFPIEGEKLHDGRKVYLI